MTKESTRVKKKALLVESRSTSGLCKEKRLDVVVAIVSRCISGSKDAKTSMFRL